MKSTQYVAAVPGIKSHVSGIEQKTRVKVQSMQ